MLLEKFGEIPEPEFSIRDTTNWSTRSDKVLAFLKAHCILLRKDHRQYGTTIGNLEHYFQRRNPHVTPSSKEFEISLKVFGVYDRFWDKEESPEMVGRTRAFCEAHPSEERVQDCVE